MKKYHDDLTTQIDIKKNFVDETAKAKAEMYNYDKKEKEEKLENMKGIKTYTSRDEEVK